MQSNAMMAQRYKCTKMQRHKGAKAKGTKVQRCNTALCNGLVPYNGTVLLNGMAQVNGTAQHLKKCST